MRPITSSVYFIQAGKKGPIKIGVARNPKSRIASLQPGHPAKLSILATMPGSYELERELHGRFSDHHVGGEWFKPAAELLAFVDEQIEKGKARDGEELECEDHSWLFDFVAHGPERPAWMHGPFSALIGNSRMDAATDGHRIVAVEGQWFAESPDASAAVMIANRYYFKGRSAAIYEIADLRAIAASTEVFPVGVDGERTMRAAQILGCTYDLDLIQRPLEAFADERVRVVAGSEDEAAYEPLIIVSDTAMVAIMPIRGGIAGAPVFSGSAIEEEPRSAKKPKPRRRVA